MKTTQINIEEPCHQRWEEMRGDEQRRFCHQCDKHVHNLSALTKAQAQELLEREADPCVIYKYDERDELIFAPEPTRLQLQAQGVRRLLAAAALAVPMMLAACEEPTQHLEQPIATSPITLEEDSAKLASPKVMEELEAPGASRAPTPPQATPEDRRELRESLGQATVKLELEAKPAQAGDEEVSCDGKDEAKIEPAQSVKEPLPIKPRRKTMGRPVRMGKIKMHDPF